MKRFLAIAMLSVFVTSASASSEKQCEKKDCETTWTQWFGHTAVLVMAEQYAATRIPALAAANAFIAEKAVTVGSLASLWIMNKLAKKAAHPEIIVDKID